MTGAEPPRWVVNRYRPRYLSELVRIHRDCFPEPWQAETFAALIAMSGSYCLCLSDAGNPTAVALRGFVLYRTAADGAEILTIATQRDWRRSGAAGLLLGDVLRQLEDLGVKNVFLVVAAENTAALALYRGHGFRTVGDCAGYYRSLGDRAADAWIMRRDLHRPLT